MEILRNILSSKQNRSTWKRQIDLKLGKMFSALVGTVANVLRYIVGT